ncbi:peroxisomal membrane protein 4 [Myriangium duriaei CBS 260.36]|uniref:Peroxisomal membrane protein 4 n=1 Tax=Myriangium duriaei CBS 260.36 TaxID=1168546 RepID=A0A9P4MPQ5_9PEZI|nr:peroxisomal membrane protein 4 [Myriangium duriaei CBS 260.36]
MADLQLMRTATERIVLDPRYHAPLTLVKAVRNGLVYGTKIRFPHALVMVFLFRSGTFREKCLQILRATRQHAQNLATFALIYKSICLLLRQAHPHGKERSGDSFVAGLVGGYYVFGTSQSSVNQQIVIYIFARVILGLAKLSIQPPSDNVLIGSRYGGRGGMGVIKLSSETRDMLRNKTWPVFASLSWASVMWLFRWYPDTLQASMRSSMTYIYDNADRWDSLRNFLWHNR